MSDQTPTQVVDRPMRADARRNYERLIQAARDAFRETDGDTSLEAIAQRAEVGIGTLYRNFPNRLALLEAVYRDEVDALGGRTAEILEQADPFEALDHWLREFLQYAATKRALFHELIDATDKDSDLLTYSRAVITDASEAVLSRAQQAGLVRPDLTASDLLRLVRGCTMMPGSTDDQRERMLDVILAGIRA